MYEGCFFFFSFSFFMIFCNDDDYDDSVSGIFFSCLFIFPFSFIHSFVSTSEFRNQMRTYSPPTNEQLLVLNKATVLRLAEESIKKKVTHLLSLITVSIALI